MNEPVEDYLDQLLLTLPGTPREVRRALAEVEAHLHDAVAEGLANGLTDDEAQAAAVARIGPSYGITGRTAAFGLPTAGLLRRTALAGSLIGGVALVSYGVAAVISWGLAALRGGTFLIAPYPSGSYTRADCARWLAGDPSAHTCVQAMTADHVGEIVLQAIPAGVLGMLALVAFVVLRTRWQDRGTLTALPAGSAEAVGAVLACLVALAGLGRWFNLEQDQLAQGAGQPLAIGLAALLAAAFFAVRLRRAARLNVG